MLPLEGAYNFRDLGGYPTGDGRRVRWRRLFRSGTLSRLTPADQRVLAELHVRTICDLRSSRERLQEPGTWMPDRSRRLSWDYELEGDAVMGAFRVGTPTPERVREAITDFYLSAPERFAARLGSIFRVMATDEAPLIVHCTAGKDRTGFVAAILLRALGVTESEVLSDYALTDRVVDYEELYRAGAFQQTGAWAFLSQLPSEVRAPLLAADPAYLQAMLRQIDERYGSLTTYLHERLEVDTAMLDTLRDLYLEH